MKRTIYVLPIIMLLTACGGPGDHPVDTSPIDDATIGRVITELTGRHGDAPAFRIERGVRRTAELWRVDDGDRAAFAGFCREHFIADPDELELVFGRFAHYFEHLHGYLGRIGVELNRQIHEDRGPLHAIDRLFGAYNPGAHVQDDLFANKLAFIVVLNFPRYSLQEKNERGAGWDDREWSYARLGDLFEARVPAHVLQQNHAVYSAGRLYISEYNIHAGRLVDGEGRTYFPSDLRLLAHWNVRDEIKANYDRPDGLPRQQMLYQVMLRIIDQSIPLEVINDPTCTWNPFANEVFADGRRIEANPEDTRRYQVLLDNFHAMRSLDPYHPGLDTYLERRFESSMEIPYEEVSALFREYAASPLLRDVGRLISRRLGRELQPFDLWYNGFLGREGLAEDELDRITRRRYPNAAALNADLDRQLRDLGFDVPTAQFLSERIEVDAARGSGHAMRASMRSKPSHLRTRIGPDGMDYKGYNIAVHEFGHNVEQTISLHLVDSYFMSGIPNTAFTEALAFMFQKRDLQLLGFGQTDPLRDHLTALDIFWDNYEMMGVSLIDMAVWQWLYANPDATAGQLKEAVIGIARQVWNEYYADVFGARDIPLLAIYSHMIQSPLYLMNYPYGRLIMFQLEDHIADKDLAREVVRIYSLGRLTPRHWMQRAVGAQISNEPIFAAVAAALRAVGE